MTHAPATSDSRPAPSVRVDGANVVICLPAADALMLRPLLQSCPCKAVKSVATNAVRDRFRRAVIADAVNGVRWPLREVHDLRVALAPCGCLDARYAPGRDLLIQLGAALGQAEAKWRGAA